MNREGKNVSPQGPTPTGCSVEKDSEAVSRLSRKKLLWELPSRHRRWWEGIQEMHLLCIGLFFSFNTRKLTLRGEATCPRSHRVSLGKLGLHCSSPRLQTLCSRTSYHVGVSHPNIIARQYYSTIFFSKENLSLYLSFSPFWVSVCHSQTIHYWNAISPTTYMIHNR